MSYLSRMVTLVAIGAMAGGADVFAGSIIDQANTTPVTQFFNTSASSNLPIGQSFTPTLGALDFVNLRIDDAGSDVGPGANFSVRIREGSILGAILGTSESIFVPDGTNTGGGSTVSHFVFNSRVALTPGSLYVIEVLQIGTIVPGNFNFGIDGNFGDTYNGGQAIIGGQPSPNLDFYFVEGIAVPEPSSLAMSATAAAICLSLLRRRRIA